MTKYEYWRELNERDPDNWGGWYWRYAGNGFYQLGSFPNHRLDEAKFLAGKSNDVKPHEEWNHTIDKSGVSKLLAYYGTYTGEFDFCKVLREILAHEADDIEE